MCVVRRTSDSCWYRARVQSVLQTLSGPQARYVYFVKITILFVETFPSLHLQIPHCFVAPLTQAERW